MQDEPKTTCAPCSAIEGAVIGPDEQRLPRGGVMKKKDIYGWETVDQPGEPTNLDKRLIGVDHSYQRQHINHARVLRIANEFSYVCFNAIAVARRPDGTYWCFDGQHRLAGVMKRADITHVPTMVHHSCGPVDEAKFFLAINKDRGSLVALDAFRCLVTHKEPVALVVNAMIENTGYRVARGGGRQTVQCVGVLLRMAGQDAAAAETAWRMAVRVFDGGAPTDRILQGLYRTERHLKRLELGSIADQKFTAALLKLTPDRLNRSIVTTSEYHDRGGPLIYGEGVVRLLNHGRRTNLIPSMVKTAEDKFDDA